MIYVTVGTLFLDFPRLIRKMDAIALATDEDVLIQTGLGTTLPEHCRHFDFKPREECLALQRTARLIVCHAGIGSILDALAARRPLTVVPRRKLYNEHLTDHQLDIANAIECRGWGRAILDINDLDEACARPPGAPVAYTPARHRLVIAVQDALDRAALKRKRM